MAADARVAVVTGGGSGIGRAIALRFAKKGISVVVGGRNQAKLDDTLALTGAPEAHAAFSTDVSDSAAVRRLFDQLAHRYGRLDILVNAAGIGPGNFEVFNRITELRGQELRDCGKVETAWNVTAQMSDQTWRAMMAVSLDGAFYCTREAIEPMTRGGGGAIINVASTAGLAGQEGDPHYSAAKAGLIGLTRSVARELAAQNIRVNVICPGFVETDMSAGFSREYRRGTYARIPLGRWASADEVAGAAQFLASEDASYITGQCLSPNGGILMA